MPTNLKVSKIIPIFAPKRTKYIIGLCQKYSDFMVSSSFYSREHEPPHIHVEGNDGMAKFDWNGKEFVLVEKEGIKANDFKKIKKVVDENADIILKRWKEYFDND